MNEPETRRLAPAFVVAPLLLGVSWAFLSERTSGESRWFGRPARILLVGLLIFGIIPTYLAPQASWRVRVISQAEWNALLMGGGPPGTWDDLCIQGFAEDQQKGINPAGALVRRWSQ
jgi:hypothetical protein